MSSPSQGLSPRLSHLNVTISTMFNVLSSAWPCCMITVYRLLHFSITSDKNVLSDSLDLFGHIKMPPWLNTHSTGALGQGLYFRMAESEFLIIESESSKTRLVRS